MSKYYAVYFYVEHYVINGWIFFIAILFNEAYGQGVL